MAEIPIEIDKGRNTGTDEKQLPRGFVKATPNFVYDPEDQNRLHLIQGRTLAGSIAETGVTAANTDGIAFARYDQGTDQIILQANDALYEADAGTTLGSWTKITGFTRSGTSLKGCQDSLKRNIFWSGGSGERPLVRDADGNWRYLSMLKPGAPTIVANTTQGGHLNPDTSDIITRPVTSVGTATASFSSSLYPIAEGYDGDSSTYARGSLTGEGILSADFSWDATTTDERTLRVMFATSSLPIQGTGNDSPAPEESIDAQVLIQVDTTGTAAFAAATTVYQDNAPISKQVIAVDLDNLDTDVVDVRVILNNRSTGTGGVKIYLYDIWLDPTEAGSDTAVAPGNYYYAVTEVYRASLSNGKTIFVESAPSDLAHDTGTKANDYLAVADPNTTVFGTTLTFASATNTLTKSAGTGVLVAWRIYRSTSTGTWPNLGLVAEVDTDNTTYVDTFSPVGGTSLGNPGLQVLYVGDAIYPLSGIAPAFLDATNHRGSIVAIPKDDPHSIVWSPPGYPDYFPFPHNFSFLTEARGDAGKGITSIGDTLILFLRNAVYRIRNLAMATGGPEFNPITQMVITQLSPSEGLAGGPHSYCSFHSQKGHPAVGWISDSGIWMTDGSLPSERGMGTVKLTSHLHWTREVATTRLAETELQFDPVLQAIIFDYYDPDGNARTLYLHTSGKHWIPTGEDQNAPKVSGPHTLTSSGRAIGDDGTTIRHWTLDKTNLRVLNERNGTDNVGSDIIAQYDTGFKYLAGSRGGFQIYDGEVYHSDWGPNEVCDIEIQTRRDASGITQSSHKKGVSLAGDRLTPIRFLQGSGQSLRVILTKRGKTTSGGTPVRAIGHLVIEAEPVDEIRKD